MLKALIFDFDGLILDTESPIIEAYGEVHRAHGKPFDRALFVRNVGHAEYNFAPWAAFGSEADQNLLEEERRRVNKHLTLRQPILPGVETTLAAAARMGLRLGVASNSSHEWVEPHLRRLGLHQFFAHFSCRGDTPSPKPEPDIYRHAANALGVRTAEAAALEDSATGVLAARRAGLFVVAIPNKATDTHDFAGADLILRSMAELDLTQLDRLMRDR